MVDSGAAAGIFGHAGPARHYAEGMEDKVHSAPAGAAPGGPTNAAVILRVLRVCLHSGFAVLLLVAVAVHELDHDSKTGAQLRTALIACGALSGLQVARSAWLYMHS